MPIEIRELNIRINVNQNQPEQDPATPPAAAEQGAGANKEEWMAECVEQVMELLKNKEER